MGKGGNQQLSDGRRRAGVREVPAEVARQIEEWIANPSKLDELPPARQRIAEQQITSYRATLDRRSATAKAGHATRRAREIVRVVDFLSNPDDDTPVEVLWDRLTARQQELVNEWADAEIARERSEK